MAKVNTSLLLYILAHPKKITHYTSLRLKDALLWSYCYGKMREPKIKQAPKIPTKDQMISSFKSHGLNTKPFKIDVKDFQNFFNKGNYAKLSKYDSDYLYEKALEHYIAAKLLDLSPNNVYIDIASSASVAPAVYKALFNCEVYRQDLCYPNGVIDHTIGGDAANMPIPDEFTSKMALHCSFEHFEGDSDIGFIKEASRVLSSNGKLVILPLYLSETYCIQTNPTLTSETTKFDDEALLCCVKRSTSHGRFYDLPHLKKRILSNTDMKVTIFVIENEKEVNSHCYVNYVALFEKR